jgi:hypothetical protein
MVKAANRKAAPVIAYRIGSSPGPSPLSGIIQRIAVLSARGTAPRRNLDHGNRHASLLLPVNFMWAPGVYSAASERTTSFTS